MGAARRKKLIEQVRQRAFEQHNGIFVPKTEGDIKTHWPVCLTCHQDVDAVNVENVGQDTVDIRAKCHGAECVIQMKFPFNIQRTDDEQVWWHIQTALNNAVFFDPSITL